MRAGSITRKGTLSFGKRFTVEIHLLLFPLLFAAYLGNYLLLFLISWASALLHELCHILACKGLKIPIQGMSILPFGVCSTLKNPIILQPAREIFMALAGPFCNLFLAATFYLIGEVAPSELLTYAVACNLSIALVNLLPCLPLDGGRILRSLLTLGSDAMTAYRISLSLSRILAVLLFAIGTLLLLTLKFQFSLLLIGAFLLGNLCLEERSLTKQMLYELLTCNQAPDRENLHTTLTFTASADLPARNLLRRLSYHRYCVIHILDENQKQIATLTQGEVLQALLRDSIRITLGEIANKKMPNGHFL
ncbi:MAG: site-2 protease family protein [Clostridia bacterium]|nr:site-2 protease family protein [Clostridia bacterium]